MGCRTSSQVASNPKQRGSSKLWLVRCKASWLPTERMPSIQRELCACDGSCYVRGVRLDATATRRDDADSRAYPLHMGDAVVDAFLVGGGEVC